MRLVALALVVVACSGPRQPPAEPLQATAPGDAALAAPADSAPRDALTTLLLPPDARRRVVVVQSHPCGGYILEPIHFDSGSSEIPERGRARADEIAKLIACILKDGTITKLEVQGHADDVEADPLGLSDARAARVAHLLASHGVDRRILVLQGYGDTQPVVPRTTPSARAHNRRVSFLVLERTPD